VDVGFKPTGTEVEMSYMQSWEIEDICFEQGHASGLAEGLTQGKSQAIILLLQNIGRTSEELEIKIQAQKDPKILDQWLLCAAQSKSIPEFEESITQ
jgi:hypothetical protein